MKFDGYLHLSSSLCCGPWYWGPIILAVSCVQFDYYYYIMENFAFCVWFEWIKVGLIKTIPPVTILATLRLHYALPPPNNQKLPPQKTLRQFAIASSHHALPQSSPIIFIDDGGFGQTATGIVVEAKVLRWPPPSDRSDDAVDIRTQRQVCARTQMVVAVES